MWKQKRDYGSSSFERAHQFDEKFEEIRKQFGGNLQAFVSGGGALDQKIGEFLNSIGLPTLQGYGLTEASPVVSCNIPGNIQIETVGPPFKTNEVKISKDGEILIRGENVMLGYWNKENETNKEREKATVVAPGENKKFASVFEEEKCFAIETEKINGTAECFPKTKKKL